jgi:putative tryptophan/tyrosine transport system substrate-binding protein
MRRSNRKAAEPLGRPTKSSNDEPPQASGVTRCRRGGVAVWSRRAASGDATRRVLQSGSPAAYATAMASFHQGLGKSGYVEGRNVAIEYRWAEGHYDQLPRFAAELVQRPVAVIAALSHPAAAAAKAATATISIVFSSGADPVEAGFVVSLPRPRGNMTGVISFAARLGAKRLPLLRELVPQPGTIGLLQIRKTHTSNHRPKRCWRLLISART